LLVIGIPVMKKGAENRSFSFAYYATDMSFVWTKKTDIPSILTLTSSYYDTLSDNAYLLFVQNTDFIKGKIYFNIIKVNFSENSLVLKSGTVDENIAVSEFTVLHDICIWGGNTASTKKSGKGFGCLFSFKNSAFKSQPIIYFTNFATNDTKTISFKESCVQGTLLNISINKISQTMEAVITLKEKMTSDYIFNLFEFSLTGEKINTVGIASGSQTNYLETARIIAINETDRMILGTYSLNSNKNKNPTASTNTQGYYIIKVSKNIQEYCKFYSFNEFKNFYNYLNYKTKNKVLKKNAKNKNKGGETELDYQLLVHDIFVYNSNFILASEAYYPEYHTEYYTSYYNGFPQTNSYVVFDGYRYTHAIVAAFDKSGTLIWDNTMEIWDILTFDLKKRISFIVDKENNMVVLYSYNGTLYSKQINGNVTIEEKDRTPIETIYPEDKVKSNFTGDIEYWYNNYFVAYGTQEIRNPE